MRASQIRVGAVEYLNTKPLVYNFQELAPKAELLFDFPSRLADRLATGELDVALIPSIEFFQSPGYTIVSDACIACRGPVLSVKLFSRVPVRQIRTLALDEGSRTSAALVQILLKERHAISPELGALPIGATLADTGADAVLLIGDRAIHSPPGQFAEVGTWATSGAAGRSCRLCSRCGLRGRASICGTSNLRWPTRATQAWRTLARSPSAKRRARADRAAVPGVSARQSAFLSRPARAARAGVVLRTGGRAGTGPRGSGSWTSKLARLLDKAVAGERLSPDEGLRCSRSHDLAALGRAADAVTRRLHPEPYRTYNIDRNINYTNVCTAVCDFCAFYRKPKHEEGYVLDRAGAAARRSAKRSSWAAIRS